MRLCQFIQFEASSKSIIIRMLTSSLKFLKKMFSSQSKAQEKPDPDSIPIQYIDTVSNQRSILYYTPKLSTDMKIFNPNDWSISDFQIGRHIGKGKYGHVYLARQRESKMVVALKVLSKKQIQNETVVYQLRREIQIHTHLRHENILKMYGFFFDDRRVYIILQYAAGGELYGHLKQAGRFDEKRTASYVSQMIKAMKYLHSLDIIHRDLKPENILLCKDDIVKLSDFGWSVHTTRTRKTFCGTIDYICPEIIAQTPYDCRLDLWTIGVLTYELNSGRAPFESEDRKLTAKKIKKLEYQMPEYFSNELIDFISRLLVIEPQNRMTEEEALQHPYIRRNVK